MATKSEVYHMLDRFVEEIGLTKDLTFDPERNAYYWKRGSATLEVFVDDVPVGNNEIRSFLRVFSFLGNSPKTNLEDFYKYLLELNNTYLGVKLTLSPESQKVFATYEWDISGIDYEGLKTCIMDLEWWADELDDELQQKFGITKS